MQKIYPHLWFDTQAKEAAEFYASVFPESKVINITTIHDTPSGDCDIVTFEVWGFKFQAISAGPYFKVNPAISFMVNFDPSRDQDARAKLDDIWGKLIEGGKVLMPLDAYPFSDHYGWVEDKYGVSWQLILTKPEGEQRPHIIPSLLFVGDVSGKAEVATNAYLAVFNDAERGAMVHYPDGAEHGLEGSVMFTDFKLADVWFVAMDGGATLHEFGFSEGVSLVVSCEDQAEIDRYWQLLSAVPEAEQCGWLKDAYGVSWQIVPRVMDEMMSSGTPEQVNRLTQAFLPMKKFDIAKLTAAFDGVE